jgi:2-isopropylmalate synthase
MSAADIWQLFAATYLEAAATVRYVEHHLYEHDKSQGIRLAVEINGVSHILSGEGNGPIDAAVHALRSIGIDVQVRSYEERAMSPSGEAGEAVACAFLELARHGDSTERYGVGMDANIVTASIKAIVSGVNRLDREQAVRAAA